MDSQTLTCHRFMVEVIDERLAPQVRPGDFVVTQPAEWDVLDAEDPAEITCRASKAASPGELLYVEFSDEGPRPDGHPLNQFFVAREGADRDQLVLGDPKGVDPDVVMKVVHLVHYGHAVEYHIKHEHWRDEYRTAQRPKPEGAA